VERVGEGKRPFAPYISRFWQENDAGFVVGVVHNLNFTIFHRAPGKINQENQCEKNG